MKRMSNNRQNLIGKKFNKLTVLNEEYVKNNKVIWKCLCDCKNITYCSTAKLNNGHSKSCGCENIVNKKGNQHPHWTGYGEVSGCYWSSINRGAKSRNLEFSITIEEIWHLFLKQGRKCALTQQILTHQKESRKKQGTASLDRIDNTKGYTIDNVQWIHKKINQIKMDLDQDEFIKLCHMVSINNPI